MGLVEVAPVVRPPLKWAGGKRSLVRHIAPLWKSARHHRLVEPQCGGLAVTLGLMPENALLNDINAHTMNFYRWLKKGLRISLPLDNESVRFYGYRRREALRRRGIPLEFVDSSGMGPGEPQGR